VSGPHATLMAYCSEFYGASGRTKIPILVGFSVSFGCIVNAGKIFRHLFIIENKLYKQLSTAYTNLIFYFLK